MSQPTKHTTLLREALQWWYSHQLSKQYAKAEKIRDGLLQDILALRRRKELQQVQSPEQYHNTHAQTELETLQQIYDHLKMLADQISPLELPEHFPIAVQNSMQRQVRTQLQMKIEFRSIETYFHSPQQSHLILEFLITLIGFMVPNPAVNIPVRIILRDTPKVQIQVQYPNPVLCQQISTSQELGYWAIAFEFLIPGTVHKQIKSRSLAYWLSW